MTPIIQHGYTIRDIFAVTDELNAKLPVVRTMLMADQMLDLIHQFLDSPKDTYDRYTDILLFDVMKHWEQDQQKYTDEQRAHDPIEFHMDFFCADDGTLLAAAHVNYAGSAYIDVLNTMETLTSYDITPEWLDRDNPDHVEEMEQRKHRWSSAVGRFKYGAARPKYRLPYTLQPMMVFGEDREAMLEDILLRQRTPVERLRQHVTDSLLNDLLTIIQQHDGEDIFASGFSRVNTLIRAVETTLETQDITEYGTTPPMITLTDLTEQATPRTDFYINRPRVHELAQEIYTTVDRTHDD